jgi:hypothetical protein
MVGIEEQKMICSDRGRLYDYVDLGVLSESAPLAAGGSELTDRDAQALTLHTSWARRSKELTAETTPASAQKFVIGTSGKVRDDAIR